MSDNTLADTSSSRYTGRVKWFNNKAGYGFVTVTDGPKSGSDIFVHHSSISVADEQYKYLVQGEYVEFTITSANGGVHEFQAGSVFGIKGGKLMCETRRDVRTTREQYRSSNVVEEPVRAPRSRKPVKSQEHPQQDKATGEWVKVASKNKAESSNVKKSPRRRPVKKESV